MKSILTGTALLLTCAAPAFAQAPICGGISLVGEWVGGDEAGSDLTEADAPFDADGQVPIAGHLVRMFTLSGDTDIRIDVDAVPAGDPYISVYDAAGTEVAADDDSGGNFGSQIQSTLGAGTYCLAARSYESGVTDVTVRIGRGDHDWPDAGGNGGVSPPAAAPSAGGTGAGCFAADTPMLSGNLGIAELTQGVRASGTAAQFPAYGLVVGEASPMIITATSQDGDPLIRILDRSGTTIAENDDYDGLDSQIDLTTPLASGEYCIEVEDLNGADNEITVGLDIFDPSADRLRRLNEAEFAPTSTDSVTITDLGALETALLRELPATQAAQWFTFSLPAGGLLVTEVIGNGNDPIVTLFDRVGRRVGENDDGPDGLDSFMVNRLLPGTYTIAVRLVGDGNGGSVRLLMERYVPAQ
ncbi:PPC domain-containing protein [Jannaschia pohangensis]|uniref:Pre-peptidase C-terminal domain-containing protein n=1 Tax=Jannaschia pohangensis TaxID=390807 RepID=A0A1I3RXF1_9RHOB|nr:PPC domain-containing protein [Jannaschia pohangensis]SFJ51028.1 hypothetical protein SAMN04488095_2935 [Jannaschia pohangensis]